MEFLPSRKIIRITIKCHLAHFPGETASAVDVDAAVIHDGYDVAAVGAHCRCGDAVVMGTYTEEQLVRVNVYEAHQAVLTQHAEDLQGDKTRSMSYWVTLMYCCFFGIILVITIIR